MKPPIDTSSFVSDAAALVTFGRGLPRFIGHEKGRPIDLLSGALATWRQRMVGWSAARRVLY